MFGLSPSPYFKSSDFFVLSILSYWKFRSDFTFIKFGLRINVVQFFKRLRRLLSLLATVLFLGTSCITTSLRWIGLFFSFSMYTSVFIPLKGIGGNLSILSVSVIDTALPLGEVMVTCYRRFNYIINYIYQKWKIIKFK